MNNRKGKQYPNPRFSSIEEEDKYWETHSPLDEGFEGEVQTSEQKRSSFLSVRMTGNELSQLRDVAARVGLGPSTYARAILTSTINSPNWPIPYPLNCPYDSIENHRNALQRSGICILNTDDIKITPDVANAMLQVIRNAWNCRMVTPDDADYKEVERLVRTQP